MRLTGWFAVSISLVLLAGCGPRRAQPAAMDAPQQIRHRCLGLGFFPGTPSFDECAKEVANQRGASPAAGQAASEAPQAPGSELKQ